MSERNPDREVRIATCIRQARAMLDAAERTDSEEEKVEFLRLAMEYLKLAHEIGNRTLDN